MGVCGCVGGFVCVCVWGGGGGGGWGGGIVLDAFSVSQLPTSSCSPAAVLQCVPYVIMHMQYKV